MPWETAGSRMNRGQIVHYQRFPGYLTGIGAALQNNIPLLISGRQLRPANQTVTVAPWQSAPADRRTAPAYLMPSSRNEPITGGELARRGILLRRHSARNTFTGFSRAARIAGTTPAASPISTEIAWAPRA